MVASLVFAGIYIASLYISGGSYLLCISPVLLEMWCLFKSVKRCRSRKDLNVPIPGTASKIRYLFTQIVRGICYCWLLAWVVVVEVTYEKDQRSLLAAFIPITSFSAVSLGVNFFVSNLDTISSIYIGMYKAIRLIFFIQLLAISNDVSIINNKLNLNDLDSQLWPIQIGALLLSPIMIGSFIYYSYFIITKIISSAKKPWNRRHMATYGWFVFTSASLSSVAVLFLKFKTSLFDKSESSFTHLIAGTVIIVVNLIFTIVMADHLE